MSGENAGNLWGQTGPNTLSYSVLCLRSHFLQSGWALESDILPKEQGKWGLGGYFQPQTRKSLNVSPKQRLYPSRQSQNSQWKKWVRQQKLFSRAEIKSAMVRAGKEFKAWKFFLLTQGKSKAFPGKCCLHIQLLSFHLEKELSSHRAEGSRSLSCGTHEVSASQHCTMLLHTAVSCSAPLLGAKGSPAPHFWRLSVRAISSRPGKHHTSFMELLRKTPEAAKENSRSSNSSQPGAVHRSMGWEEYSPPKPHPQWWYWSCPSI